MTIDIDVVTAGPEFGAPEHLVTLVDIHPEIFPRYSGTARYLVGRIRIPDGRQLGPVINHFNADRVQWVVIDGTHIRIQGVEYIARGGHGWLLVDQSAQAELFRPGGGCDLVRLVEPSPPTDVRQWWRTELERAQRERDAYRDMETTINKILTRPDGGGSR